MISTYSSGDLTVIGPTLLRPLSGSVAPPTSRSSYPAHQMLATGQHSGHGAFNLLFISAE